MAAAEKCLLLFTICCLFYTSTGSLMGGVRKIDNEDIGKYGDLLEGLEKAAKEIEEKKLIINNSNQKYEFIKSSLVVTSQVVQGTLYGVKVDMGPSECSKDDLTPVLQCIGAQIYSCTFKVWSRVWLPPDEKLLIEDLKCEPKSLSK